MRESHIDHDGEYTTNPFILDSQRQRVPFREYAYNELRYLMLTRTHPEEAEKLMQMAEKNLSQRWAVYEEMATRNAHDFEFAAMPTRTGETNEART